MLTKTIVDYCMVKTMKNCEIRFHCLPQLQRSYYHRIAHGVQQLLLRRLQRSRDWARLNRRVVAVDVLTRDMASIVADGQCCCLKR